MDQNAVIQECCFKDSDTSIRIHFHNAYELLFIRTGHIRIHIGDAVYDGGPGSVFVIGRFEEHFLELRTPIYERYYVILNPDMTERLITDRRLLMPLRSRPKGFCHRYDVSEHLERFELIFRRLIEEQSIQDGLAGVMHMSLISELLILLCRLRPELLESTSQAGKSAVFAVQRYIDTHYAEPIRVSDLAERVFLTPCYLTHCFKNLTGYSPKQYLVQARLAAAKDLLIHSDLPVSEVAFHAGFSDVNNFIRAFRRETGCTPLRYREREQ